MLKSLLPLALLPITLSAQTASWTEPFPAHKVIGNIYYVGARGVSAYLITTPEGNILINTGLEKTVPLIQAGTAKLGFKFSDVKILLVSHAHWDHNAGAALVKQFTGAKYMVMAQDVAVTEDGGRSDFNYGKDPSTYYKPTKVDRVLHDGDEVKLGGTVLTAHLTAGHTKGCTTWTMKVRDGGRNYDVVILGSANVNSGYKLVNNKLYPEIADDYRHTFQVLQSLHCDVFLGAHGEYYGMERKFARMTPAGPNVFVDPQGYKDYVADREQAFLKALAAQSPKKQ